MRYLILVLCFCAVQAQAAWDLNDVSYLMPLPTKVDEAGLLRVFSLGSGGPLIPNKMFETIPFLTPTMNKEAGLAALRVIAVRIDPCFPLPTPQSCQRQIRFVWQPIEKAFDGGTRTVDAALHSFYVLTDSEFHSLVEELSAWKADHAFDTHYLPLQVHPAWAGLGTQSPSLVAFNKVILKYVGERNLTRVTAMLLRRGGLSWSFIGYDVANGELEPFPIPRLGAKKTQMFMNLDANQDQFMTGGISPYPRGEDIVNTLVAGSDLLTSKDEETIRLEVRGAFRAENPGKFTPENMDCATCHLAQSAATWVKNHRSHLQVENLWSSEIYKNAKYNLANSSVEPWNTHSLRSFGYFGKNLAVSQRVINESAEVADSLNSLFPLK